MSKDDEFYRVKTDEAYTRVLCWMDDQELATELEVCEEDGQERAVNLIRRELARRHG
jgi:hypothetical protein